MSYVRTNWCRVVRAVHVVAKRSGSSVGVAGAYRARRGGVVSVPACEIGREVRHVPPGCVPHALYAQETCGMSRNLFLPRLVTKQYVSLSSACNGAFRLKLTYIHAGRGDFIHACVHKNCSLVTFKAFIVGFQLTPTLCEMKNFVLPSHRIS